MKNNKLWNKIMQSYGTKTLFFAGVSLVMNLAFAVMNGVSAALYSSLWYGAMAGYYLTLILFRGSVLSAKIILDKKNGGDESLRKVTDVKIYLASGAFLVILEVAMAIAITQMILLPKPTQSGQIMAISTAAYTFYSLVMAIVNIVKAKRTNDLVTQTFRNLNFATACMSMLSLTVSLIATFGEGDDMVAMKATVGFTVCALTLAMATYMIVRASKIIKKQKGQIIDE